MNSKICVIGGGRWGSNHIRTLIKLGALAGIVENNSKRAEELKSEYPSVKYFNDVTDAVAYGFDGFVLATPAETHFKLGKYLLENKTPVLIEKPITTKLEDAIELNNIARENKVNLMVGHVLLFHPAFIKIKQMLDNGDLGKLQYMYSNRLNLGTIRTEENVFWSFAPHDIALFQYFTGSVPLQITSNGSDVLQPGVHDTTITTIKYPDNIMGHIFVSWLHPFKEHRFVVVGSRGMIHFEDSREGKPLIFYDKCIDFKGGIPIPKSGSAVNIEYNSAMPLEAELQHFIKHLGSKSMDIANGESAIEVMEILIKATDDLLKDKC